MGCSPSKNQSISKDLSEFCDDGNNNNSKDNLTAVPTDDTVKNNHNKDVQIDAKRSIHSIEELDITDGKPTTQVNDEVLDSNEKDVLATGDSLSANVDHNRKQSNNLVLEEKELSRPRTISIITDDGCNDLNDYDDSQADTDIIKLYDAMQRFSTDMQQLITIIVPAHPTYRKLLRTKFEEKYEEDLVKTVKCNSSGTLQYILVHILLESHELIAYLMRDYIENCKYVLLSELLTSSSTTDINKAKKQYERYFESSFVDDVQKSLDDLVPISLKGVVVPLCTLEREVNKEPDDELILNEADKLSQGPDEIQELLLQRSYSRSTLAAIFKWYKLKYYLSLTDSIDIEFHDDTKAFLTTIVQISEDAPSYFATQLAEAIGNDDEKRVANIVIARRRVDYQMIKKSYYEQFDGKSLSEDTINIFSAASQQAIGSFLRNTK